MALFSWDYRYHPQPFLVRSFPEVTSYLDSPLDSLDRQIQICLTVLPNLTSFFNVTTVEQTPLILSNLLHHDHLIWSTSTAVQTITVVNRLSTTNWCCKDFVRTAHTSTDSKLFCKGEFLSGESFIRMFSSFILAMNI